MMSDHVEIVNQGAPLERVESLGLNCELGFVLRGLGNWKPSVFRWSFAPPESVIKLIEADFAHLYEPSSLVPQRDHSVVDTNYGVRFHTNLKTEKGGRDWQFVDSDTKSRLRILEAERDLIRGQAAEFRARYESPGTLYVLTRDMRFGSCATGDVVAAIERRSKCSFAVLEVKGATDRIQIGSIIRVRNSHYEGYISSLAPSSSPHEVDLDNWRTVLTATLAEIG
jgi:hypothetical protein